MCNGSLSQEISDSIEWDSLTYFILPSPSSGHSKDMEFLFLIGNIVGALYILIMENIKHNKKKIAQ